MSWLSLGRLGSILANIASRSDSVWPSFSPRPLNAWANAPRVSLSFSGSILDNTDTSCWNTVLISTVTWFPCNTWPARSGCGEGSGGGTNSMNFEPNTVVEAMSTSVLAGMRCNRDGSIARWIAACPLGSDSIESTLPTCAPCSLTFASRFITRPVRGDSTVTGTLVDAPPLNRTTAPATIVAITTRVARPASG